MSSFTGTLLLAGHMCAAVCAGAQSLDALTVTIADLTGAVVPEASVVAVDKTTESEFYGLTNGTGQAVMELPAGFATEYLEEQEDPARLKPVPFINKREVVR